MQLLFLKSAPFKPASRSLIQTNLKVRYEKTIIDDGYKFSSVDRLHHRS